MNLLTRLKEVATDDAAVKLIFDHIRNLGICALVMGVARYSLAYPEVFGPVWVPLIYGTLLALSSVLLIVLNALHGLAKAMALTNPLEKYVLYFLVNAIGPMTIIAVMTVGPFR